MSYLNRKIKSIMLSGLLSMGIVTANYIAFNKEVVLVVDGQEIEVNSFQPNVQGVLEENKIDYDSNDIISEDLDTSLKNGMKIEVQQVEKKTITETKDIPYDTVIKKDKTLLKGKTEVSQKGKKGTKEKKKVKTDSKRTSSAKSSLGKKMIVSATAYSGDGITATGTVPKWGTIAVDPNVIPYGTKVYIPQFGKYFIAEDCGGGIKGNKIDIFMNSESQCNSWGKRTIDIYIVE